MKELWKCISMFDKYEVSNFGRVRSWNTKHQRLASKPHILKAVLSHGYPHVGLCNNHGVHFRYVHTLVASAFLGIRPHGKEINHIDGNRSNNHVKNLEYVTHKDNMNTELVKKRIGRSQTQRFIDPVNCRSLSGAMPLGKSGFRGVSRHGNGWRATITGIHIGVFRSPVVAAKAWDSYIRDYGLDKATNRELGLL